MTIGTRTGKVLLMSLVQIGALRQKTVLEMILELSDRQAYEIDQLKRAAAERAIRRQRRPGKTRTSSKVVSSS